MKRQTSYPKEQKIIEVYNKQKLRAIDETLDTDALSKRDIAISRLLIETGLRSIDVCKLKLTDIDWNRDFIRIIQGKTKQPLIIPLRSSYGNAIVDYILDERPDSSSEYRSRFSICFDDFNKNHLKEYLLWAGAKWTARTCNLRLTAIRPMLSFASEESADVTPVYMA